MKPGRALKLDEAPRGKRLIVCGGREYYDRERVFLVLDQLAPTEIAQGGATGADALAKEWARTRNVPCQTYKALWGTEGYGAGKTRNRRMFYGFEPDGTVAFPGNDGTKDMDDVTIDGGKFVVRIR